MKPYYSALDASTLGYFERVERFVSGRRGPRRRLPHASRRQPVTRRWRSMLDADGFADDEERELFVDNVFREVDGHEQRLATDQGMRPPRLPGRRPGVPLMRRRVACSRVLEKLLAISSAFHLRVFADRLQGQYAALCADPYASHVVQTLFALLPDRLDADAPAPAAAVGADDPGLGVLLPLPDLLLRAYEEVREALPALTENPYGSHVVRVVLVVLSGRDVDESLVRSAASRRFRERDAAEAQAAADGAEALASAPKHRDAPRSVPDTFVAMLGQFAAVFMAMPPAQLQQLATHTTASPVLQCLLRALAAHDRDAGDRLALHLLRLDGPVEADTRVWLREQMVRDPVGGRLLEAMLEVPPRARVCAVHRMRRLNGAGERGPTRRPLVRPASRPSSRLRCADIWWWMPCIRRRTILCSGCWPARRIRRK